MAMNLEQLGPYRLVRRLGRGGMGAVYEGLNVETGETAAVKVLSGQLSHEQDFRQRFAAEIETLRRLNHPNIVRLFGFGQQQDQLYYAMELVEGVSLEEEIQRGRQFGWRDAVHIGSQTCLALRHAHDRGIIHRDIKPANLLWAPDGSVKLSDFGIARLFGSAGVTTAGNVIGTIEYMAPEQADGRPVGPQADLYSLGGVLFALLAGRPPFVAKSLPEMLHKQRYEHPPMLTDLADDVPEDLANLVDQLLEKEPADRVRNATLLGRRLEAIKLGMARKEEEDRRRAEAGFHLAPAARPPVEPDEASLAETRALDDSGESAPPKEAPPTPVELPQTMATDLFRGLAPPAPGDFTPTAQSAPSDESAAVDQFTAVAEHELDQLPEPTEPRPALISPQTWILAAALVTVGLLIWYILQPPSADALFARIKAATDDGQQRSIIGAEDDIKEFLWRYAEDPRSRLLLKYDEEIQLHYLEAEFNRRVKGLAKAEGLLPIESAYLEACNYVWLDPALGARKLRALVDLYEHESGDRGPTAQCLELARRRLAQMETELAGSSADHLAMIETRLDQADGLRETDPDKARKMYEAVVELYRDKPWAAQAVQRAEAAIAAPPPVSGEKGEEKTAVPGAS
ncbi:MAG: protein kinase [Pirellulales bacterium]|nr:protein kinase [Pirellulales bacterium]